MENADKENVDRHLYVAYTNGVAKKKDEPRIENITIKATQSLKDALSEIASENQRSVSQTALLLIQRGLAAYRKDGLLTTPAEPRIYNANNISPVEIMAQTGIDINIIRKVLANITEGIDEETVRIILDAARIKTDDTKVLSIKSVNGSG